MNKNLSCFEEASIIEVMEKINLNLKGVVFIIDVEKKLKGIITDGDIRRLLLKGVSLNEKIGRHVSKDYVFAFENEKPSQSLKKIDSKIKIIPIVRDDNTLINYFEFDNNIHLPVASPNLEGNELSYLLDAFLSSWISSSGKYIQDFEDTFAKYCGMKYAVSTSNGTTALHLSLLSLDIKKGDEVIIPNLTFAATINAVLHANATPVIVDIDENSWCISPDEISENISQKTKAIIPVHIYGQPCNMSQIKKIAKDNKLHIIEDCAEAHGASIKEKKVGSFGRIGCFSFFGNKIITTGEGGMCVTNSKKIRNRLILLRDHGMDRKKKYWHKAIGYNYRMTNIQAAIGVAQLERIDEIIARRERIEKLYIKHLSNIKHLSFQKDYSYLKIKKVVWLVSALIKKRKNEIMILLHKNNIDVRPFFFPLDKMKIYKNYSKGKLENSYKISKMGLNFPTNQFINEEEIKRIKKILAERFS